MQTLNQFSPMDNLSTPFNPSLLVGPGNEQQQPQQKLVASAKKGGANIATNKKGDSDKPKRPLSAYNLFFQHERAQILKSTPSKYDGAKPRRSHGKIGFGALARSVAARWNSIEPEERKRFDEAAAADKERYKKEMDAWKTAQASLEMKQQQTVPVSPPAMSDKAMVRCNLMAASPQASQATGRPVFSMAAVNNSSQAPSFFPSLPSDGQNDTRTMDYMRSVSVNGNALEVVGHALEMLDRDLGYPQEQQVLERVESEETMFSHNNGGQERRVSGTVPHISELAAKLDDDCLGFMAGLLF